ESNAIVKYLADKQNSSLYPKDLRRRALVDQWIDFSTQHIATAVGRVFFNRIIYKVMNAQQDERSLQDGLGFLQQFLPVVDAQLKKSAYLADPEITLADLCLLADLDPAEVCSIDLSPYSNLQRWRDGLRTKDFYQKCFASYTQMIQ